MCFYSRWMAANCSHWCSWQWAVWSNLVHDASLPARLLCAMCCKFILQMAPCCPLKHSALGIRHSWDVSGKFQSGHKTHVPVLNSMMVWIQESRAVMSCWFSYVANFLSPHFVSLRASDILVCPVCSIESCFITELQTFIVEVVFNRSTG